ncbi:2OG-Fe(II) oxygenase family protein [Rhizoctonia solani AG-3 Rhs1AP]|uniref:2OG-Fe(II) oxygenase family protein n=1 Tax=Rhizoctonia solani AG-3 Rhs1AP TaxID=1086054 RepID=X8JAJ4_9AGAM|nr:2OG-Fe(II) oxygenase family protein [Rhizoctonia solani AG-3 Rhs1AP]
MSNPLASLTSIDNRASNLGVIRLDPSKLGLPEYRNKFAIVIDNLFSPEDCQRFLRVAESEHAWSQATLSGTYESTPGSSNVSKKFRNSSRIILDSPTLASELFTRLEPHLSSIEHLSNSPLHAQFASGVTYLSDPPAKMVGFNQRLRFLRYSPGKKHCDGNYHDPDSGHISYYTLQLYLNDIPPEQGGSTRFWGSPDSNGGNPLCYVDVQPKLGRALIFEQSGLWHSGQDVLEGGEKYTIRAELMYEVMRGRG